MEASKKKWWFIGCGCALVLCLFVTAIGGILGLVWYSQQGGKGPLFDIGLQSRVKAVVTDQAAAIKSGDFESAYDLYMSRRYKAETDGPGFAKTIEANVHPLLKYETLNFLRVGGNETRAQVVADVVGENGDKVTIEYMLVKESDGSWKIDEFKRTEYRPLP